MPERCRRLAERLAESERRLMQVQTNLRGVWRKSVDGCPHLYKDGEGPDRCDLQDMTVCVYELGSRCDLFIQILKEWCICPECGQERPGDERVLNGMKCTECAY